MQKIEFTDAVKFGDKVITEIKVEPLRFVTFSSLWTRASTDKKPEARLQRLRIQTQAHFTDAEGERVDPTEAEVSALPIKTAKAIIDSLEEGQGTMGKVVEDGDGISKPAIYKLGTPIAMTTSGKESQISELEFHAKTYAEVEDILVADGEIAKTAKLLETLAVPVGTGLMRLPGWALDRITVADGVGIMRAVTPNF